MIIQCRRLRHIKFLTLVERPFACVGSLSESTDSNISYIALTFGIVSLSHRSWHDQCVLSTPASVNSLWTVSTEYSAWSQTLYKNCMPSQHSQMLGSFNVRRSYMLDLDAVSWLPSPVHSLTKSMHYGVIESRSGVQCSYACCPDSINSRGLAVPIPVRKWVLYSFKTIARKSRCRWLIVKLCTVLMLMRPTKAATALPADESTEQWKVAS